MNISISNIAWDQKEDQAVMDLLKKYGVNKIDVAPGKYFSIDENTSITAQRVKHFWNSNDVDIIGMQSLLFGTTGLNVFGSEEVQQDTINHLSYIFNIAEQLGVDKLTFGSPKNRNREGISDKQALEIAVDFFRIVGKYAEFYNVILCLEPNPTIYGANFMTTTQETADVVRFVNHPNIKMQLDLGAVICNNEDLEDILEHNTDIIGHIHISEPNLVRIGSTYAEHKLYASLLDQYLPNMVRTIEMVKVEKNNLQEIEKALSFVCNIYK